MDNSAIVTGKTKSASLIEAPSKEKLLIKKMKALVYHGPGKKSWEDKTKPIIIESTDVIVKIIKTR